MVIQDLHWNLNAVIIIKYNNYHDIRKLNETIELFGRCLFAYLLTYLLRNVGTIGSQAFAGTSLKAVNFYG